MYSIRDWDQHFETSETRKLESLKWVPAPNKHDGLGFRRMAAQRDRCELFAAWNLILQIASKGRKGERGRLCRDGQPLTALDMSLMTGFPEAVFTRALSFFSSDVQWLTAEECREIPPTAAEPADDAGSSPARPADSPAPPGSSPAEWKEGKNGRKDNARSAPPADLFEEFWQAVPNKIGKGDARKAWLMAIRKATPEVILAGVDKYVRYEAQRKKADPGDYRPLHPSTWLNQERWCDELQGDKKPARTLVPGQSAPEALPDPVHWPEYLEAFPVFAGMHFAQLTAAQQGEYHEWALPLVRRDWEESKAEEGKNL